MDTTNNVKHKPATPLPWHVNAVNSKGRITGDETSADWDKLYLNGANNTVAKVYRSSDVRFAAHAANAYPRLVAALREVADGRDLPMHEARALLRELGEVPEAQ